MAWDIGAVEFTIGTGDPLPDPGESGVDSAGGGGGGGGGGGLDSFGEPILPTIPSSRRWLVLGKFFYDSGTAYHAITPVQHPDYFYEARVLQWGFLDRSIPVPTGLSQVGDCRIRVADTDRQLRDRMRSETPRRRFIELRWVPEGGSESEFPPFATFEIKDMEFQAGDATITGRDVHFAWIFKKFPNLVNRTNFPDLITGLDEAQMPVITGIVVSRADNLQGVIPLPRISLTRWGLAAHPIQSVIAIYRRYAGEGIFTLVDTAEYTVTQDPPQIIEGIEYNLTFIDFGTEQDYGAEIRADVEGINYRGPFFGMPEVFGAPLRNPVDFLINLLYVMLKTETEFPAFNIQSFIHVRNQFESTIETSAGFLPYYCDGAITEILTCGEILTRFLTSFELDLYANRYGELELNITLGADPLRPLFDDTFRILRNSVRQRLANPTYNRLRYRFERNYAEDEWGSNEVFNNLPDQLALGKIEEDTFDEWFVRDVFTAGDVCRRRAEFVALGSFRIEFDLPAPEVQNDIELAKLFEFEHYGALVNGEYKTTGITTDLDQFKTTLRGVLRVPQVIENPGVGPAYGSQLGSSVSAGSFGSAGPDSCAGVTGTIILPFGDFETFANDSAPSSTVTPCQVPFNPADYEGLSGIRFKGTFIKWDPDDPGTPEQTAGPDFSIVDEDGTVYLDSSASNPTLSFSPNPDDPFYLQADVDVVFPYDPANPRIYYIKETNDAINPTDSNEWQGFGCALYVSVVDSDQVKLDAQMLPLFSFQKFGIALNYTDQSSYAVLYDASVQQATYTKIADAQSEIDYREGYFIADAFTAAGFGAIFKVGGAMVPGTEIAIAAGDTVAAVPYSVQFQDGISGFEAGDEYVWKFKNTGGSAQVHILSNGIRTKIGNAEDTLCAVNYETQHKAFIVDCELRYLQRAWKYVASEWTNGELFYFEATWHNGQTVNLVDTGTDVTPIDPPTVVSGSPLTFPGGAAFTTMRSGALTLIDGHWYTVTIDPDPAPITDVTAMIIIVRPPTP